MVRDSATAGRHDGDGHASQDRNHGELLLVVRMALS
jgi:hypothetical protein